MGDYFVLVRRHTFHPLSTLLSYSVIRNFFPTS
nr:MAG TPA: hypothetical protein [Bacteriophage sp.]